VGPSKNEAKNQPPEPLLRQPSNNSLTPPKQPSESTDEMLLDLRRQQKRLPCLGFNLQVYPCEALVWTNPVDYLFCDAFDMLNTGYFFLPTASQNANFRDLTLVWGGFGVPERVEVASWTKREIILGSKLLSLIHMAIYQKSVTEFSF